MSLQRIALWAGALTFVAHLVANPHYGFFRDELYFIVCGRHPALGYVDQPPLVPFAAALSQVFGTSLVALRSVAALCAAVGVYASCLLSIELGGGAFAVTLTGITVALAPVLTALGARLGTDTVELWTWPLATLFVVRAVRGQSPAWLWAGIVFGIAILGKYSALFYIAALLAGVLLTPRRSSLANRWFLAGAAATIALALPNVAWQAVHGFPMMELLRNGQHGKNVVLSPPEFLAQQFMLTGALLAVPWLCGLVWLFRERDLRWLAFSYVFLIVVMIALHAKDYYPAAVYPALFAAGGVALERWTSRARVFRPAIAGLAFVAGIILVPFTEPVLPLPAFIAYMHAFHMGPTSSEHHRMGVLPQDYADMFGWNELTESVAHIYDALPAAERRDAVIFASNYGEAAAIDVLGRPLGLPGAASGHNSYYLWGPPNAGAATVVDVNGDLAADRGLCRDARIAAIADPSPYAMPYERDVPIILCRGLHPPLGALWPRLKNYI